MQSRGGGGSFSPSKKQSTTTKPQKIPSLIKSTSPFKFKFTINTNPFTIKEKDHNYHHSKQHHQTSHHPETMATLQRFKLFATHCGVAPSPTRSPRTSPIVHLRRRKTTLRTLLGRSRSIGCRSPQRRRDSSVVGGRFRLLEAASPEKAPVKRNSLKELFVSSPPPPLEAEGGSRGNLKENRDELVQVFGKRESGGGLTGLQGGPGSPRPVWSGFRYRSLLRRAWRPVLVSIPE